jgi:hypothetical protein
MDSSMRIRYFFLSFLLVLAFTQPVHAQSTPLLRIVATHAVLRPSDAHDNDEQRYKVQCPAGHVPTRYSVIPAHGDEGFYEEVSSNIVDRSSATLDRNALSSIDELNGGGYLLGLATVGEAHHNTWNFEIVLSCVAMAAGADGALVLVKTRGVAAPATSSSLIAYCPADFPVALGGFSNAESVLSLIAIMEPGMIGILEPTSEG